MARRRRRRRRRKSPSSRAGLVAKEETDQKLDPSTPLAAARSITVYSVPTQTRRWIQKNTRYSVSGHSGGAVWCGEPLCSVAGAADVRDLPGYDPTGREVLTYAQAQSIPFSPSPYAAPSKVRSNLRISLLPLTLTHADSE